MKPFHAELWRRRMGVSVGLVDRYQIFSRARRRTGGIYFGQVFRPLQVYRDRFAGQAASGSEGVPDVGGALALAQPRQRLNPGLPWATHLDCLFVG